MERELGSSLDRNINAQMDSTSGDAQRADQPRDVWFSNVTYRPTTMEPYDSDAAYAAAHPYLASGTSDVPSPVNAASTTTIRNAGGGDGSDGGSPGSFGDGLSPRSQGPASPQHRNALMRGCTPEILLWHAGSSLGDPVYG